MHRPILPYRLPGWLLLVALAAVVAVPVAMASSGGGAQAKPDARKRAALRAEHRVGRELLALRTRTSKTFVGRDGERVARLYAGSVHYRDARGGWRAIDPTLQRLHGRLLNRRNGFSTSLPLELGRDTVRVRKGRRWLSLRLRGARGRAVVDGNSVRYPSALPGVDLAYAVQSDSVKEDLILAGASSQRRFAFDLAMSDGLRPDVLRSGALALRDRHGRTRLALSAPFMVDAKRRSAPVRPRVAMTRSGWRLRYSLDDRWLDSPRRAWPVTVDPSPEPYPDPDCYLDASVPDSSFCAANPMKVGVVGGHDHRVVMRFPMAGIPRGAEVAGATLVAWQTLEQTSTLKNIAAEPLTEPFTSATTWNRADGTDRWSEPGGEVDAGATAEFPGEVPVGGGDNYWTMLKLVREWASGKRPNHGMVLSVPGGGNGAWLTSSESTVTDNGAANHKPYLTIPYKERIGARRGWVHESQRITDRIGLGVNVASGNLLVRQTDFSMPGGLGPGVAVSRSYNSLDDVPGSVGGWTLDTGPDFELAQFAGGNYMRLRFPSGAKGIYDRKPGTNEYTTPPGFNNTLAKDVPSAGKWQLTDHSSQTKFRFENHTKNGRLYEVEDRNGRKLTFVYNATSGRLERIEDSNNDASTTTDDVRFTFASATQLTQMTDPAGRTYGYAYTGGLLTSYTDPQNGTSFKTLYEYNGPGEQLSKITTPQGNVTTVDYYPTGHEYAGKVKTVTRVTDTTTMTGPTTSFEYLIRRDGSGETRVTDPIGSATADDNDRVTRHVFDEQGRVTKTIDALARETSSKLTTNSNVQSYTAASNGGTTPNTTLTYDGDDNMKSATTPVNAGSILGCADFGAPDPASGTPEEQRCDSPAPDATYGPNGYEGVPITGTGAVSGGRYLVGRTTNPEGDRTNFTYTTQGNLSGLEQTENDGDQVAAVSMSHGNGADGMPGRLNSITDARSGTTTYGYDAKGNVSTITPPNPGAPNPTGPTRLTYHQALARVDKVQDGKDNWRLLTYDNLDRLTKIEFTGADQVLGGSEPYVQFTYDRDGNQTQEDTREEGTGTVRTRSMTYDKLNRVTLESLPGGVSNAYTYDRVGNLRSLTDAGGKVEYTYNAVNEVRAVYDPGATKPTKFEHTVDGQRSKTTYPNGATMAMTYDDAFRLSEILSKDGAGTMAQKFNYAYKDPVTARETPLIFEKVDGKLGQATRYVYDGLDRLDTATIKSSTGDWGANTTLAKYDYNLDAAGNVTKASVSGTQAPNSITDYGYNAFNELCARQAGTSTSTPPACPTTSPAFTYDKNGNELAAPSWSASYNLLDQTTTLAGTTMVYLGVGQGRKIVEGTATLQHNVLGLGKRTAGGSTDYFTRDDSGTLVSRRTGSAKVYYFFDALGSVTGHTDDAGNVITRRDYDPYGAPAPGNGGEWADLPPLDGDINVGQFGFAAGQRSVGGLYHFGQRYYDPTLMRWTQPDPLDQAGGLREGNRYAYVGGDPVNLTDPQGLHSTGERAAAAAAGVAAAGAGLAVGGAGIVASAQCIKNPALAIECGTILVRSASYSVVAFGASVAAFKEAFEGDGDDRIVPAPDPQCGRLSPGRRPCGQAPPGVA